MIDEHFRCTGLELKRVNIIAKMLDFGKAKSSEKWPLVVLKCTFFQ